MPVAQLKKFLDEQKVDYFTIFHTRAYTTQEIAAKAHIPGKELAKTVIIRVDGRLAMAVLPGSYKINFDLLKEVAGTNNVELASEQEFRDRFPGCEIGAMPPFGNLYGMEVFVAKSLTEDDEIAFNAGNHAELIRLAYKDFEREVKPIVGRFSKR